MFEFLSIDSGLQLILLLLGAALTLSGTYGDLGVFMIKLGDAVTAWGSLLIIAGLFTPNYLTPPYIAVLLGVGALIALAAPKLVPFLDRGNFPVWHRGRIVRLKELP